MTERKFTPPTEFPAHYVTGDGQEALVLGVNPNNKHFPFVGYLGCVTATWDNHGCTHHDIGEWMNIFDKPVEVVQWINDYEDAAGGTYRSRLEADQLSSSYRKRIAVYRRTMIDGKVVKIEIEEAF